MSVNICKWQHVRTLGGLKVPDRSRQSLNYNGLRLLRGKWAVSFTGFRPGSHIFTMRRRRTWQRKWDIVTLWNSSKAVVNTNECTRESVKITNVLQLKSICSLPLSRLFVKTHTYWHLGGVQTGACCASSSPLPLGKRSYPWVLWLLPPKSINNTWVSWIMAAPKPVHILGV